MGNAKSSKNSSETKFIDLFINKTCDKCIIKKYRYYDLLIGYEKKYKTEIKKILEYYAETKKIYDEINKLFKKIFTMTKKEKERYKMIIDKKKKLLNEYVGLQIRICQKIIKIKKYFEIFNEYILCMKHKCSKFYNKYMRELEATYNLMMFSLKSTQILKKEKKNKNKIKEIKDVAILLKKLLKGLHIDTTKMDKVIELRVKKLSEMIKTNKQIKILKNK